MQHSAFLLALAFMRGLFRQCTSCGEAPLTAPKIALAAAVAYMTLASAPIMIMMVTVVGVWWVLKTLPATRHSSGQLKDPLTPLRAL